jgi:hypothetical protein
VFEIKRNTTVLAFLLLLILLGAAAVAAVTGAAKPHHSQTVAGSKNSNQANSIVQNTGDLKITITSYQGGRLYQQTIDASGSVNFSQSVFSAAPAPAQTAVAGDIVFSEIYAGGGNSGSTYENNYLELFNRTANTIDINGWRFYFSDATGTFNQSLSFTSSRGIGIGPGRYLLIQFGLPSPNSSLPFPDLIVPSETIIIPGFPPIPPINLSPSGKVFLTGPNTSLSGNACPLPNSGIVDFVGYGSTANCFEGGGAAPTLSSTTAAIRQLAGCADTNNNNSDLLAATPSPRNSSSTANFCSATPPEVQFIQPSFDVTEQSGSIAVVVVRNGNTSGTATVDYTTADNAGASNCHNINGRASSRCDYIATVGTLNFAAGETTKQINIPLIDDSLVEGTETFSINLSNPAGATLGTPILADIFIHDPDAANGPNPIDQASFFVRQHYVDFLNREPDTAGSNFWIGEITNCTPQPQCTEIKRINVSAAFFLSIEFQETGYLAYRAFKTAYGDAAGQAMVQGVPTQISVPMIRLQESLADAHAIGDGVVVGQPNYQQILENNKVAYFATFVSRQRFLTDYPATMTPAEFVDKLNQRAGNVLSSSERDTLVTQLQSAQKTPSQRGPRLHTWCHDVVYRVDGEGWSIT